MRSGGGKKKNRSAVSGRPRVVPYVGLGVTFACGDEIVPGLGDVGEGEVDHGSRVAAARERRLPQGGHRAVFLTAVASRRFSSFLANGR